MAPASSTDLAAAEETPGPPAAAAALTTDQLPGARWIRWGIVLLAAAFRLWALDLRPPHFDEGVNGMFTDQMQRTGFYRYDPTNYHGPLHFYILFVFKCLLGRNLWALRLPEALMGIFTVDWLFRFDRFFGKRVCAWAALAMAVSPGFTFFNRYAIHETWLVFFMVLGCWGLFGLWREGTRTALWAAGMGLAGMILTKETYVIHVGCLLAAVFVVWVLGSLAPEMGTVERPTMQLWSWRDFWAVAGVGVGAILFFYSGAGFNPAGIGGLVTTFTPWAQKASQGEGHTKPFIYWFKVLWRNEPWAVAGLCLCARYLAPSRWGWPMRLLAVYGAGAFVAYSLIPYKTPWCVVSIAWPFLFVTAAALVELCDLADWMSLSTGLALGLGLAGWSGYRAWDLNFQRCTDEAEDYVYVHTFNAVNEITGPLYDLAAENPAYYHIVGVVLCDSVHPLPWLLGDFSRVSYYTRTSKTRRPLDFNADFLIVTQERAPEVEAELKEDYFKEKLRLRPSLTPVYLYLRRSLFAHLMAGRDPEFRKDGAPLDAPDAN